MLYAAGARWQLHVTGFVRKFHAKYGEYEVTVEIESGVVNGKFPSRALTLAFEWHRLHKVELLENWELAKTHKPLKSIAPLG